ncbi:MAG: hypothetical protein ACFFEW_18030 [Candidatus Thorarchaeota archaeon]
MAQREGIRDVKHRVVAGVGGIEAGWNGAFGEDLAEDDDHVGDVKAGGQGGIEQN